MDGLCTVVLRWSTPDVLLPVRVRQRDSGVITVLALEPGDTRFVTTPVKERRCWSARFEDAGKTTKWSRWVCRTRQGTIDTNDPDTAPQRLRRQRRS